jgi:hypothetical protein
MPWGLVAAETATTHTGGGGNTAMQLARRPPLLHEMRERYRFQGSNLPLARPMFSPIGFLSVFGQMLSASPGIRMRKRDDRLAPDLVATEQSFPRQHGRARWNFLFSVVRDQATRAHPLLCCAPSGVNLIRSMLYHVRSRELTSEKRVLPVPAPEHRLLCGWRPRNRDLPPCSMPAESS